MAILGCSQLLKSKRFGFWFFVLLIAAIFQLGCCNNADSFFSGRPSEMAIVHNRALDGTVESMIELLRAPNRFPDAKESHMINWQGSIIAWWQNESGLKRIVFAFPKLTLQELDSLEKWVSVRGKNGSVKDSAILDEIGATIKAFHAGQNYPVN